MFQNYLRALKRRPDLRLQRAFCDRGDLETTTPISPPSSLHRGYDRQAGPTHWPFQGPPAESKFLAVNRRLRGDDRSGGDAESLGFPRGEIFPGNRGNPTARGGRGALGVGDPAL